MRSPKKKAAVLAKKRAWERANPEKHQRGIWRRRIRLLRLEEHMDEILNALKKQQKCAICGTQPKRKGLHIDHDHRRGVFRGLICERCNIGLGHFQDDPIRLRAAAKYLLKHRDSHDPHK
jgi:hypothetical protein